MTLTLLGSESPLNYTGEGEHWCPWCGYMTGDRFKRKHGIHHRGATQDWGNRLRMVCRQAGSPRFWTRADVKQGRASPHHGAWVQVEPS